MSKISPISNRCRHVAVYYWIKDKRKHHYLVGASKLAHNFGFCFDRLVLRCRSEARQRFARLRSDVLVKLELLDNKHVQDIVFQLKRLMAGLSKFHKVKNQFEKMWKLNIKPESGVSGVVVGELGSWSAGCGFESRLFYILHGKPWLLVLVQFWNIRSLCVPDAELLLQKKVI